MNEFPNALEPSELLAIKARSAMPSALTLEGVWTFAKLPKGATAEEWLAGAVQPIWQDQAHNMITYAGRSLMLSRAISGNTTYTQIATGSFFIGVGDSNVAASEAQTDLQATTNRFFKAVATITPTLSNVANPSIEVAMTLAENEANFGIWEAVLATGNNPPTALVYSRVVRPSALTKTNNDTIAIKTTWRLNTPA